MKIAFIGLGNVGFPLARNLLGAGHDMVLHDPNPARAEPLVAAGARFAATVAGAYGPRAWSTQAVKSLEDRLAEPLRAPGFSDILPGMADGSS